MKTILITYMITQGILWAFVLITLLMGDTKGIENRVNINWSRGGNLLFFYSIPIAMLITSFVTKIIITGKIIDAL